MKWYIGQEIISLRDHKEGVFKKDTLLVIRSIRNSCCKCDGVEIDIGIKQTRPYIFCYRCDLHFIETHTGIWWFGEDYFIPLDELMSEQIEEIKLELSAKNTLDENEKIYLQTKSNYKDNGIYEDNETDD